MSQFSISRLAVLCCGVSLFVLPGVAFAQAPETEDVAGNGDIIVTATRESRSLKDVPMSVNVVTSEQIAKLKIFDVKDISQLAPGLELTNNGGRNNTTALRGQSFDPDQGTSPTIQVFLNEIAAPTRTRPSSWSCQRSSRRNVRLASMSSATGCGAGRLGLDGGGTAALASVGAAPLALADVANAGSVVMA